ncbi:MAG: phenylalanine--tRNA ligase beta subunit-related protein [Anaerolineae bacterium]
MLTFDVSETWKQAYPSAVVGFLVLRGAHNPPTCPALEARKAALEADLRARFGGGDRGALKALPLMQAYSAYYKRFQSTYHVLLQVESVALKGKALPRAAALVEAMFMAELRNMVLTAGHDLATLRGPIRTEVADGSERFLRLNGTEQTLRRGDMYMADDEGIISVVLHGPDQRSQITSATRDVLFCVYAPEGVGVETVRRHLENLRDNVLLLAPSAELLALEVIEAPAAPAGA